MQTLVTILLDAAGAVALSGGVALAVGTRARLRAAESGRRALEARLAEIETRHAAELGAAAARCDDERRALEARYEARLKKLTAAAAGAEAPPAGRAEQPRKAPAEIPAPAARVPTPKSLAPSAASAAGRASRGPVPVLLASGNGECARSLTGPLEAAGYAVGAAGTVADILETARKSKPAVIALDVHLGRGGDGFKALSALKADPELQGIPVVLICPVKDRDRAVELGAAGCVASPAAPNVLLGALNAAMVAHKKRAERSRLAAQAAKGG